MRGGIFVWMPKRVFQNTKIEPKGSVSGEKVHSSIGENTKDKFGPRRDIRSTNGVGNPG